MVRHRRPTPLPRGHGAVRGVRRRHDRTRQARALLGPVDRRGRPARDLRLHHDHRGRPRQQPPRHPHRGPIRPRHTGVHPADPRPRRGQVHVPRRRDRPRPHGHRLRSPPPRRSGVRGVPLRGLHPRRRPDHRRHPHHGTPRDHLGPAQLRSRHLRQHPRPVRRLAPRRRLHRTRRPVHRPARRPGPTPGALPLGLLQRLHRSRRRPHRGSPRRRHHRHPPQPTPPDHGPVAHRPPRTELPHPARSPLRRPRRGVRVQLPRRTGQGGVHTTAKCPRGPVRGAPTGVGALGLGQPRTGPDQGGRDPHPPARGRSLPRTRGRTGPVDRQPTP